MASWGVALLSIFMIFLGAVIGVVATVFYQRWKRQQGPLVTSSLVLFAFRAKKLYFWLTHNNSNNTLISPLEHFKFSFMSTHKKGITAGNSLRVLKNTDTSNQDGVHCICGMF